MKTRALFVSDIHISSPDDPRAALFGRLLDKCLALGISDLFLVGDIFDFWIADRPFLVSSYARLIVKIQRLITNGVNVHYFEGNHDLDLRAFWQKQLGVDVRAEAAYFSLSGLTVRVEHGDQMDPGDRGYLFLRWLLRTPVVVFLGRWLPERLVRWIGVRASRTSREYTSNVKTASDEQARHKMRVHALKAYSERAFDILVSGHVHVEEDFTQTAGDGRNLRTVNLGTWLRQPLVFDLQDGRADLRDLESFLKD